MTTHEPLSDEAGAPTARSKGEEYERLAFTFCKTATLVLLTHKFALPIAAGAAAVLYLLADRHGKKDTRCILKHPRLIALFWGIISVVSLFFILRPMLPH